MIFHRLAGLSSVAVLAAVVGQAAGQAPPVGPPPSGPPVPLSTLELQPPRPADPGPPPAVVPPPSGPFGSGFVYEHQPPPPPPPLPGDWFTCPPPGWFTGLEAAVTRPSARETGVDGSRLDLDWTVAPRVLVGYRFEHGGALLFGFRYLQSETTQDFSDVGGPLTSFSLEENWFDITYLSRPYEPWCNFRFQWEAGVRTAYLRIHGHEQLAPVFDDGIEDFVGAGPELGLCVSWQLGHSGVGLFGRSSVGVLFGQTRNTFQEVVDDGVNPPIASSDNQRQGQTVVDWRGEVGVSWAVPHRPWFRFDLGVQGEVFGWDHVVYSDVGPFLRCLLEF
jgi:hypothetical protein